MSRTIERTLILAAALGLTTVASGCKKEADTEENAQQATLQPVEGEEGAEAAAGEEGAAPEDHGHAHGEGEGAHDHAAEGFTSDLNVDSERSVELVSAGEEPRQELRYDFENMQEFRLTFSMSSQAVILQGANDPIEQNSPVVSLAMDFTNPNVGDDGALVMNFAIAEINAETNPENPQEALMVQMMRRRIEALNFRGTVRVDDRGQLRGGTLEASTSDEMAAQFAENVQSTITQAVMLLPEEAVGAGAVWKSDTTSRAAEEAGADQATTLTLTSFEDNTATITQEIDITLPEDTPPLPAGPSGVAPEIDSFEGSGEGNLTLRLDQLAPSGTVSVSNQVKLTETPPEGEAMQSQFDNTITTELTVGPIPAPEEPAQDGEAAGE